MGDVYLYHHLVCYALSALGDPQLPDKTHDLLLLAMLNDRANKVEQLIPVPTWLVPEEVADTHEAILATESHPAHSVCFWGRRTHRGPSSFEVHILPVQHQVLQACKTPGFHLKMYSTTHGTDLYLPLERGFLFK
jgi:hypothetical protein